MSDSILTLGTPANAIGIGDATQHMPGTKLSGPRGVEAIWEYAGLFMNVRDWIDTILITSVNGIDDADIRDTREVNPGAHGETPFGSFYGGRTIVLQGKIVAKTIFKLRDLQQALRQAFSDISVEKPLYIHTSNPAADLFIYCKKTGSIQMTEEQKTANHFERNFQITLRASNPRFVSFNEAYQELVVSVKNLVANPSAEVNTVGWSYDLNPPLKNYIQNPSAEIDLARWVNQGFATFAQQSPGSPAVGNGSFRFISGVLGAAGQVSAQPMLSDLADNHLPVNGGETFTFAARMVATGSSGTAAGYVQLNWYDDAGTFIGANTSAVKLFNTGQGYINPVLTVTLPATARRMTAYVVVNGGASGGQLDGYFDAVQLTKTPTAPPYFDGDTPGYGWDGEPHASTSSDAAVLTNLVTNPSFETNLAGWTQTVGTYYLAPGQTWDRVLVDGEYASRVIVNGSNQGIGALLGVLAPGKYTARFRVKGANGGENINWYAANAGQSILYGGVSATTLTTEWSEQTLDIVVPSGNTQSIAFCIRGSVGSGTATFYIDKVSVVRGPRSGYFDGDSSGGLWTGTPHASTSTMKAGGVVNYVSNPLGSRSLTNIDGVTGIGYLAGGAALTSVPEDTAPNDRFIRVVTTATINQGVGFRAYMSQGMPIGTEFTVAGYVRTPAGSKTFEIAGLDLGSGSFGYQSAPFTATTDWQKFTYTFTSTANMGAGEFLQIAFRQNVATAGEFHVAGVSMTLGDATHVPPESFDGNLAGMRWYGLTDASPSILPYLSRSNRWSNAGDYSFRMAYYNRATEYLLWLSENSAVTAGQTCNAQFAYNALAVGTTGILPRLTFLNNVGAVISYIDGLPISTLGRGDTLISGLIPTGAVWARIEIYPNYNSSGMLDINIDDVMINEGDTVAPYFDGSFSGASWAGTAHYSVSSRTQGSVQTINDGNFRAEPKLRVMGPLDAPANGGIGLLIENDANSEAMLLKAPPGTTEVVAADRYVEIDTSKHTMKEYDKTNDEFVADVFNKLDISSDWMNLEPGSNVISGTVYTPTSDPIILVRYRHTVM